MLPPSPGVSMWEMGREKKSVSLVAFAPVEQQEGAETVLSQG